MPSSSAHPAIVLVPGYWLGAWAWDEVVDRLTELGHDAKAVTLPGLESKEADRSAIRFQDHVDAVANRVDAAAPVVLVAHSGAGAVATAVADRAPDAIARVVYLDSGPVADGHVPRPDLRKDDVEIPFPGLDVLAAEGVSGEGLTDADRAGFEARAVAHPSGACREPVRLRDPRRNAIATTLVCSSIPSADVQRMAAAGNEMFAPLTALTDLTLVDLSTGHWAMMSRPSDLADVIAKEAARG